VLQSEVANAIADQVTVTVTAQDRVRLARTRPVQPAAYEHYLRGRFASRRATADGIQESARQYERAIEIDPSFAAAYAGLAHAYNNLGTLTIGVAPPSELRPKALASAAKALQLDQHLAEAHGELGFAQMRDWQWERAGASYRRAIDLSPSDADIVAKYSDYLGALGRSAEGIAAARRARELDPLSAYVNLNLGIQLYAARRYQEAIEQMLTVVEVDPSFVGANVQLGLAYTETRQFEKAINALQRAVRLTDRSPAAVGLLAGAYGRAGRAEAARPLVAELERRERAGYVPSLAFVYAYAGLDDHDRAFAWLERAYHERSNLLAFLKVFPLLDPLRDDPRFKEFQRRVNLT
jgi:tetratricopeptide (TPR) repeat protein